MADISKVTLPNGNTYNLKDEQARNDIIALQNAISGGLSFIGETTTNISDGSTTNPVTINGTPVTATTGDLVVYGSKEFVWDGSKWLEFGDLGSLGALAFKDSASGTYTPAGSVSQPTFTGNSLTSTGTYQPEGSVTVSTNGTTNKTAAVSPAASGTVTYTPDGTVSAPTISVSSAGSTTTVKNPTSKTVALTVATAAPNATAPANAVTYCSVANETLSLYQLGYTTGASITTSNVTVKNGDASYTASAPAFTGTGVRLVTGNIAVPNTYTATFTGTSKSVSVSGTPTGTVSQPTFTGTQGTVNVS